MQPPSHSGRCQSSLYGPAIDTAEALMTGVLSTESSRHLLSFRSAVAPHDTSQRHTGQWYEIYVSDRFRSRSNLFEDARPLAHDQPPLLETNFVPNLCETHDLPDPVGYLARLTGNLAIRPSRPPKPSQRSSQTPRRNIG